MADGESPSLTLPVADWTRLRDEPDLVVSLPGGGEMRFRRIPAGSFWMGSRGKVEREEPRHRVVLPHDFWLGKFVVTQAEWRAVAALSPALVKSPGLDPSDNVNTGDRRPVTNVSWDDATAWCGTLAQSGMLQEGWKARLPTEAEWEYACRAGTNTQFYSGDSEEALARVAWFGEDWDRGAHAVDERPEQHPAGLFGMHGNVEEWCDDVCRADVYREREDGVVAPVEELRKGGGAWQPGPRDPRRRVGRPVRGVPRGRPRRGGSPMSASGG